METLHDPWYTSRSVVPFPSFARAWACEAVWNILHHHLYHRQHSDTIIFRASWTKVPGWLQIDDANEVMVRSEKRVCLLLAVVHVVAEVKL